MVNLFSLPLGTRRFSRGTQNAENSRLMENMALKGAYDAEHKGKAVSETVQTIAQKITIVEQIAYQPSHRAGARILLG
jgi:hypothetical protein